MSISVGIWPLWINSHRSVQAGVHPEEFAGGAVTTITAFEISAAAQDEAKHQVLFTNVNLFDGKIYKDAF